MKFTKKKADDRRNKIGRAWVVVDLAGNPLRQFSTKEEAEDCVKYDLPGRRIQEMAYDLTMVGCQGMILN